MEADVVWRQFVVFPAFCDKVEADSLHMKVHEKKVTLAMTSLSSALNMRSKRCTMLLCS
jgi:hypothetical protein